MEGCFQQANPSSPNGGEGFVVFPGRPQLPAAIRFHETGGAATPELEGVRAVFTSSERSRSVVRSRWINLPAAIAIGPQAS
jgi:hypothetical protein